MRGSLPEFGKDTVGIDGLWAQVLQEAPRSCVDVSTHCEEVTVSKRMDHYLSSRLSRLKEGHASVNIRGVTQVRRWRCCKRVEEILSCHVGGESMSGSHCKCRDICHLQHIVERHLRVKDARTI